MINGDQLNETYGHSRESWEAAKTEARRILAAKAKARDLIEYGELAQQIPSIHFDPHGDDFRRFLGQLSWEEDAAGRAMITAIVVHKLDKRPGGGFFVLAQRLGRDVSDLECCWSTEVRRVFTDFR
jgi:hypothetical protein